MCVNRVSSLITRDWRTDMGYPTKVQLIRRKASEQWYVNFPSAIAQAMEFARGEVVEWIIEDKGQMVLRRRETPPSAIKKGALD